jgi:hypothetical protein
MVADSTAKTVEMYAPRPGARPKVSTRSKIGKQISDPRRMTMQMFACLYNFVHSALDEESHLDGEQQGGFERLSS